MAGTVWISQYRDYDRKEREDGNLLQVGLPGDDLLCEVDDIEPFANTDASKS
jgi:hypothetical protein